MPRINKSTTLEQFIAEAKRLRTLADDAEGDFLSYLYEAEQVTGLWKDTGLTFLQFLEQTNLCRPSRYDGYRAARNGLGAKGIEGVGIHAVVAAGRFRDAGKQREMLDEARTWERTNGTPISAQTVSRLASDLRSRILGAGAGHKSYTALASELVAAKEECDRLRVENATLRAEIRQLRKTPKRAAGSETSPSAVEAQKRTSRRDAA